jgi:predicted dehydrogenase
LFWDLGSIGRRHAKLLKELYPEVEIIAIRSRRSLNRGLGEITGIINVFSEEEAFKNEPDIVFITNPTSMHVDSAIKAVEKDCHLFIEKPLSNELKNVDT